MKLPSSAQTGNLNLAELSWLYNHGSRHPHPPTRASIKTAYNQKRCLTYSQAELKIKTALKNVITTLRLSSIVEFFNSFK